MKRFLFLLIALFIMQTIIGYNAKADDDRVWTKETHDIKYVKFSPDGTMIATTSDGQVLIHDVLTKETLHEYSQILKARFTPDGKYIVGYHNTNELIVIDVATWQRRDNIQKAPSNITTFDISSDGKKIIAAYELKYEYCIWDIESGQIERTVRFPIEDSANSKWAYMLDIYYGKDDKTILFTTTRAIPDVKPPFYKSIISTHLVDANSQEEIHRMDIEGRIVAISNNKSLFVHQTFNNNIFTYRIFNPNSWQEIQINPSLPNYLWDIAFSQGDTYLVYSGGNRIVIYDIQLKKAVYTYDDETTYGPLSISKDDKYIVSGVGDLMILLNGRFNSTSVNNQIIVKDIKTFPNPTNTNSINIEFYLILPGLTKIQLYDLTGRIVRNIENDYLNSGQYRYEIDLNILMNGEYNLTIETLQGTVNHKILINR